MPLDRHAQRFLKMLALSGPAAPGGAAQRRHDLEALREIGEVEPEAGVEVREIEAAGATGPLAARLYAPRGTGEAAPALLYLHGGGWVAGSLDTHDGHCRRLAVASGCKIVALDYRLAPEHRFPAALEDAVAAMRWLAEAAPALGADPARLMLGGDSAGGALAAAAALELARAGGSPLALLLLICPILDLAQESASRQAYGEGHFLDRATMAADVADYLPPGAAVTDPRLSPLLAPNLSGLPPTLIHTAEFDPFRDEGQAFAARLGEAGVAVRSTDHAGMIHYFYALPRAIPYASEAAAAIGAEIKATISG